MNQSLFDFVFQMMHVTDITEKYGDKVADKIFWVSHQDENILGVFFYIAPEKKLIYSDKYKDHASFPEHKELMALPPNVMLLRGRVVQNKDDVVVMIYLAGDEAIDPTQTIIAELLHQLVRKTGLPIRYIVDVNGKSLLSENVLDEIKNCTGSPDLQQGQGEVNDRR